MTVAQLRSFEFFTNYTSEDLATIAKTGRQVKYPGDQRLFHEGAIANACWIISSGQVDIDSAQVDTQPVVLQSLGAGDMVGWSWLIPPYRWHFGARTASPTAAFMFDAGLLKATLDANPQLGNLFTRGICRILAHRLQASRFQALKYRQRLTARAASLEH